MKMLSDTEAELKKSLAYIKECARSLIHRPLIRQKAKINAIKGRRIKGQQGTYEKLIAK